MLKNYLISAWRNILKQKGLSFVNIVGLSAGIACFSLIMLYALNELSFDRFHKNASNIYRVFTQSAEDKSEWPFHPLAMAPEMAKHLPDVIDYVRLYKDDDPNFVRANNNITLNKISFSDPQLLTVFSFKLKAGDAATALKDPHSIVLTASTAHRLFGRDDVLGNTLEVKLDKGFVPFTITAVAEDLPPNSDIEFTMLGNINYLLGSSWSKERANDWSSEDCETYLLLKPGSGLLNPGSTVQNPGGTLQKSGSTPLKQEGAQPDKSNPLVALRHLFYPDEEAEYRKKGWTGKGPMLQYGLQPLLSMHTDTRITRNQVPPVDPKTIWILLGIGAGILLISCVNFTTLAIGRSAARAKEVGIRKVIGGSRRSLTFQFLTDAMLLTVFSAIIGFLLAQLLLPYLNNLAGRSLDFSFTRYPALYWTMGSLVVFTGLLSGGYPAWVLSRFRPVEVLKRKVRVGGANLLTGTLVTIQFLIAAGLIVSTIIILLQLNYLKSESPGFNKENVVVIDAVGTDAGKIYPLFRQGLSGNPSIAGIACAELGLGQGKGYSRSGFTYEGRHQVIFDYCVDPGYLPILGMQLIAGRNFDPSIASDSTTAIIVNQAMVNSFGWSATTAIGQQLKGYSQQFIPVVIGVVKDFNFKSFSEKVAPQMFTQFGSRAKNKFFVRLRPGDPTTAMAAIQQQWNNLASGYPLQYSFLDQDLDHFYRSEQRLGSLVGWAGGISIFLSCLGLFGLATLAVANRIKEISVRKVLGAPIPSIISLLSTDFLRPVALAILVASPVGWYLMNNWLQGYAYRIHIQWWIFAANGAGIVILAFLTICFHTARAALSNPVRYLRME